MTAKKPGAHYFRGSIAERLEFYSIPEPNSGCVIWIGALDCGYGVVGYQGKIRKAHVIAYELEKGPLPEGLEPDHKCRLRCCINTDHLEPVTRAENVKRGWVYRARATHCPHGHEFTPENTYIRPTGWRSCRACQPAWHREHKRRKLAVRLEPPTS